MGWTPKHAASRRARALAAAFLLALHAAGASAQDGRRTRDFYPRADPGQLIALGERLFFDPRLSGGGRTACATCHRPEYAFAEPRRVSLHANGDMGTRNAPSLVNVRQMPLLMWDGRFRSLEEQAFNPFRRNGEMGLEIGDAVRRLNADRGYARLFHEALGQRPTANGLTRALAAYQRTLASRPSRFDRFQSSGDLDLLTSLEHEGFAVFNGKGRCATCHLVEGAREGRPELFTDFEFHNIGAGHAVGGVWDAGRYRVTRARRDGQAFRTPPLRNVAVTAPYMHDGGLATLDDVIDFYDEGGRRNPNLSPLMRPLGLLEREKAALVAFLRSLTDEDYEQDEVGGLRE